MPTSLLTNEQSIFVFLLALVGAAFAMGRVKRFERFFHFFPPLIFCYFLPMIATTAGITPAESPLYGWFSSFFLPPILFLLLISADPRSIARLGPVAVGVMLAGTTGIVLGAVSGYALFSGALPEGAWKGIGALAGSWSGGSANMVAVKQSFEIPDDQFALLLIVDSVMVYSWMGVVIALAAYQQAWKQRFGVNEALTKRLEAAVEHFEQQKREPATTDGVLISLALAIGLGYLTIVAGREVHHQLGRAGLFDAYPTLKSLSAGTITVMLITVVGVVCSFLPAVRRLEDQGASRLGYALLFLLLPMYGAQANLAQIGKTPYFAAVGACMIAGHVAMLLVAMRLWRTPLFFGAVGSQANMGGPASASVVAATYQPALAPVGVLLGVLGGIMGTYVGLLTGYLCSLVG